MTDIEHFEIHVSDDAVEDLRRRLGSTRWPDPLPGEPWQRGVPRDWLRAAVEHWRTGHDWRKTEARLNEHPQVRVTIDGQPLHALHVVSPVPGALPLLLLHGWPGSVLEFLDVVGPLTDPAAHGGDPADAFSVVIPSLPGHGWSTPLSGTGWTHARMGAAVGELMTALGHRRYGVQGGDAGAFIAPECARAHPADVVGVHVNALVTFPRGDLDGLTDAERTRSERQAHFQQEMFGYAQEQGTRPLTVGYGLHDSPAGQLAWIAEKFYEWSDPADRLAVRPGFLDTLLDDVSIYWFTGTATSSANLYWETQHDPAAWAPRPSSGVPTAVLLSQSQDVAIRRLAEEEHHVVRWTETDRGGHFLALEAPDVLVDDVRAFFRDLR